MTEASLDLENVDKWLGDRKWDVIHFNWGLWDICYRHPDSKQQGQAYKLPAGSFFTVTGGGERE